jgi:hypothetical protein
VVRGHGGRSLCPAGDMRRRCDLPPRRQGYARVFRVPVALRCASLAPGGRDR